MEITLRDSATRTEWAPLLVFVYGNEAMRSFDGYPLLADIYGEFEAEWLLTTIDFLIGNSDSWELRSGDMKELLELDYSLAIEEVKRLGFECPTFIEIGQALNEMSMTYLHEDGSAPVEVVHSIW